MAANDELDIPDELYNFYDDLGAIEDDVFVGFTVNGELYYAPTVDNKTWVNYNDILDGPEIEFTSDMEESEYTVDYEGEDVKVDGYIFGIPVECDEDTLKGLFTTTDGEFVDPDLIVVESPSEDGCGTGTKVFIFNESEEIIAAYVIVYRGDIDGSAAVDDDDRDALKLQLSGAADPWNAEIEGVPKYIAGDVDGSFELDDDDLFYLKWHLSGKTTPDTLNNYNWVDLWQPGGNGEMYELYPMDE